MSVGNQGEINLPCLSELLCLLYSKQTHYSLLPYNRKPKNQCSKPRKHKLSFPITKCQEEKELHKMKQRKVSPQKFPINRGKRGRHLINNGQERKLSWLYLFRKQSSMNMNTCIPRFWVIKAHILIHKFIHPTNIFWLSTTHIFQGLFLILGIQLCTWQIFMILILTEIEF